jgi:hypothetical protein
MLLLACPAAPALSAQGPLASLEIAQQGIDACDSDMFNRVVDVPSVVNSASDAIISALSRLAADGELDGGLAVALTMIGADRESPQMALIKPLLVSEIRGFVAAGINGGYFAGTPKQNFEPPRGSLASTLEKMPVGRRRIVPGKILSQEGDTALVSATFVDPKAGPFALELAMRLEGELWRVREIANAEALVREAVKRDRR